MPAKTEVLHQDILKLDEEINQLSQTGQNCSALLEKRNNLLKQLNEANSSKSLLKG